ncbi:MAG: peptidyl-prolyl cis-trans isomerase [Candidatus Eisenbacteria bacterium]
MNERVAELPEQYRANYSTPEGRQQLLERLVEEKVWLLDATRNGVAKREAIQRQLEQQRRDLLVRTWVNELMAQNPPPSDSEAKVYYDQHAEEFKTPASVTLRHIQLKSQPEAKKVMALAQAKGADWDKLVKAWTTDTLTKTNGGSLGTTTREGVFSSIGAQPGLAESAMALGIGKIGGPFKTNRGWHVIKVDDVRPDGMRNFEQVRTFIVKQISQQRTNTYYQDVLAKAKARLGVKPDSAVIKSFYSAKKSARDLFQDAQQAGTPQQRIAAYQRVVDTYPDADVSPQAQFMVGFIHSEELKEYEKAEAAFRALLKRYPKSELAASASWMVEHMRTEEAPGFLPLGLDSTGAKSNAKGRGGKL